MAVHGYENGAAKRFSSMTKHGRRFRAFVKTQVGPAQGIVRLLNAGDSIALWRG